MSTEATIITESAQAVESAGGLGTLGINLKLFIAQLINFLVVLFVLWKWAFGPIVKRLEARTERIDKGLKDAEAAETRLKRVEEERALRLAEAEKKSLGILEDARTEATLRGQDIIEKAKREVERVVAQGRSQLQTEKESMIREARADLVNIAIFASERILKEEINEKKSRSLAEEVVRKMT